MTATSARSLVVGTVTAGLAALLIGTLTIGAARQAPVSEEAYVRSYNGRVLHDGLEILLVQSDGQAFAEMARDPSMARPEEFDTPAEAAYREQRPLLSYLAWATSFGHPSWVPPALAALFALAVGLAAAGLAGLLEERGCSPWFATGLMVLPGTYAALTYFGPEVLGLALVVWGYRWWTQVERRSVAALVCFGLAGLTRETMLLVPAALAIVALAQRRPRDAAVLATSAAGWLCWVVIVHVRVGAWPTGASEGRLSIPFAGLVDATEHTSFGKLFPYAALGAVIVLFVVVRSRETPLKAIVLVQAAFATMLGKFVWIDWYFFARVLLPMYALGFVAILAVVLGQESRPDAWATKPEPVTDAR